MTTATTATAIADAIRDRLPALIAEQDGQPHNDTRQRLARSLTVRVITRRVVMVSSPTALRREAVEVRNLATMLLDGAYDAKAIPQGVIKDFSEFAVVFTW